jgi:hypothetical protein
MEIIKPAPVPGAVAVREVSTPTPLPDAEPTIALVDPQGIRAPTVRDAPTIQPVVLAGVERSEGRATAPASDGGSVRGVIIRGGVDERRDPCVIHGPGGVAGTLGGIGVLINDPTPRGVGIGARGGTGAVIGGSPRGGVMFAGGIR